MQKITRSQVPVAWRMREEFSANGTLIGRKGADYSTGRMPAEWAERYAADRERIVFTVLSYATPIAWVLNDGTEVRPPVKYSVTTSKHQGRLY